MNQNKLFLQGLLVVAVTFASSTLAATPENTHVESSSGLAGRSAFSDLNGNGLLEPYENSELSDDERISDLIRRLSVEEKIALTNGTGFDMATLQPPDIRVAGAAGESFALERFGIPSFIMADGPAGIRITPKREGSDDTFYATAFPVSTVVASSWNKELGFEVGRAMGHEVKEYGIDVLLAPGMNLHRNPLAGRNFEYFSEDPVVSGKIAAAVVNGVESQGVGATLKHFVANNSETNRFLLDTIAGERALRELYLRGFEIAVKESQPWAIMSSYNKLNGVYTSQSEELLTTVLRDEWKFDGMIMTDWFSGDDIGAQVNAGNDLMMPGNEERVQQLKTMHREGKLDITVLDRNIRKILALMFKTPAFKKYKHSDRPDLKASAEIARRVASEGVILLKNEGKTLPLDSIIKRVAAFGNTSYQFISGGGGSGDVNEAYTVSLVDGMRDQGLVIDSALQKSYQSYLSAEKAKAPPPQAIFETKPVIAEMKIDESTLLKQARNNDVAFITIGRNSSEHSDREIKDDFNISDAETDLIRRVSKAFKAYDKRTVVILNIGNVIETASWRALPDAIVLPWQGGQEAGNALADVLTGKVNPSGKLATTFPMRYSDIPSAGSKASFPGIENEQMDVVKIGEFVLGRIAEIIYSDNIYVGYRYFDTFRKEVAYEFGYGLSYSKFEYSKARVSSRAFKDEIQLSIEVTNKGDLPGKEAVQLYVAAPTGELEKPQKELRDFVKTKQLLPGESQVLKFTLKAKDIASFSPENQAWIVEKGKYKAMFGSSSRDIRGNVSFKVSDLILLESVKTQLAESKKFPVLAQ